jgi:hypothetical protein
MKMMIIKKAFLVAALLGTPVTGFCASAPPPSAASVEECAASLTQSLATHTKATGKQIADAIEMYCKGGK